MLRYRVLSTIVLVPLVIGVLALGGWWFLVTVGVILSLAVWEFARLMRQGNHRLWLPAAMVLVWLPLVDLA